MPQNNIICDECDDTFRTEQELQDHKMLFHSPDLNDDIEEERPGAGRVSDRAQNPAGRRTTASRPRSRKASSS